jgi:hypothetical protein
MKIPSEPIKHQAVAGCGDWLCAKTLSTHVMTTASLHMDGLVDGSSFTLNSDSKATASSIREALSSQFLIEPSAIQLYSVQALNSDAEIDRAVASSSALAFRIPGGTILILIFCLEFFVCKLLMFEYHSSNRLQHCLHRRTHSSQSRVASECGSTYRGASRHG